MTTSHHKGRTFFFILQEPHHVFLRKRKQLTINTLNNHPPVKTPGGGIIKRYKPGIYNCATTFPKKLVSLRDSKTDKHGKETGGRYPAP